jgi:hypothetical protein
MECIRWSLPCSISLSNGMMFRFLKRVSVCADLLVFAIIRIDFFCSLNMREMFDLEVQLIILIQYSRWG